MADIKGLSILMNMKDVGVERSLKQIKAQFKTLSSEMTRSNADFKNTERSMSNLNNRTKELRKGIDVTENSMKDIANQLKKMSTEEQRSSVEAEKLRLEYSRQNRALNMYQRQLNQTETELNQFGQSTKRTVFSMDKIDNVLGTMRRQLNITNMAFERGEKSTKGYESYLNSLNVVIEKHKRTIQTLETRYRNVARQQGVNSQEALQLRQKILQEKQSLDTLEGQYRQTSAQAQRFAMEQKSATMSMTQIRQKITQVAQSLRISANNFKLSGQTASAYKAKIESLNNGMKQQQLIVQNLAKQYDYAKHQYGATSKEAQELGVQLSEERLKLKSLGTELNSTTQAHRRLKMEQQQGVSSMSQIRNKMTDLNNTLTLSRSSFSRAGDSVNSYKNHLITLKNNMTQQKTVLRELTAQYNFVANAQGKDSQEARELASAIVQQKVRMNELESEIRQTGQAYNEMAQKQRNAQALSSTGFGRAIQSVNRYKESINSAGMAMRNIGSNMSMYISLPVVAGFGAAIKKGMDFESQMAKVGAIAGASRGELKAMTDQAVDLGAKSVFSASEVGSGMKELSALGFNAKQTMSAIPGVIDAAAASGADMSTTATIMASTMNSFGLEASKSGHIADVLAMSANKSAADVSYMGEALKYAGTPAHSLGMSLEDTSGAIMAMSNAGLKGEQAGTTLRASLIRLAKPTKASQKAMDELGISLTDSKGKFVGMPSLVGQFQKGLQGMTKEQKLAAVSQIVGTESASGFLAMIDAGPKKIGAYSKSLKNSDGASKEAADKMNNTLKGAVEQLGGAFESLAIKITQSNGGPLTGLIHVLTGIIGAISKLPGPVIQVITVFAGLVAAIGPLLMITGAVANGITGIAGAMTLLNELGAGEGIMAGFRNGIAKALGPIRTMIGLLRAQAVAAWASLGPYALIAGAIAAVGVAFYVAYKKSETFRNIVNAVITPVKNSFMALWNVIKQFGSAIKSVFSGDTSGGLNILKKIMPPEAARQFTATLVMLRGAYNQFISFIRSTSVAIGSFFRSFWQENGTIIINAFNAVKNTIGLILSTLFNVVIKPILAGIRSAFSIFFGGIKAIVINVFTSIRMIVQGSLTAISGVIKLFKGIFTGDFGLMWQGIKQIFSGALMAIGGLVRMTFGNLLIFLRTIGLLMLTAVRTVWNVIKNVIISSVRISVNVAKALMGGLRSSFVAIWNGIKTVSIIIWNGIKNAIISIIRLMIAIAKRVIGGLRSFIVSAWNFIKAVSIRVWNAIKNGVVGAIRGLSNGVRKIITTLRSWIVSVWSYIKNKVVGLAKALGTGVKRAFNSLWGAVKKVFGSIRNFSVKTWTYIRNKVIALAKGLYSGVKRAFSGTWNFVKRVFSSIRNYSVKVWSYIRNKVISLAKGLYNGVKKAFNNLWSSTKSIFGRLRNWTIKTWKSIKSSVVSHAKGLWSGVKGTWSRLKNGTSSTFGRVKSDTISKWKGMKNSVTGLAKGLWSSVRNTFRNMASGLKTLIGRIKSHISNMVGGVKGGLNKLIGGVNWVAGKLGMDKLPTLKLHTGTTHTQKYVTNGKINQDTFATVGDKGRGNGPGGFRHEMIRYPNGRTAITPNRDTTAFLPKGSRVYNGAQTHSMLNNHPAFATGTLPKFASGTMFNLLGGGKKPKKHKHKDANDSDESLGSKLGNMWGGVKNATSKAVSTGVGWAKAAGKTASKVIGDVLDYIEKPSKLVEKVFDIFGVGVKTFGIPSGAELPFNMMKGMFGKLKKGAIDKVKNWLEESGGGDGGYIKYLDNITTPYSPNGPPPGYAFSWPHPGIDLPYKYEPVYSTISGTARGKEMPGGFGHYIEVIGGALKVIYGHLSKWNIKQGQKVHPGTKLGISGNTGASTGPHLHYEMHRNGKPIDPVKWLKSHNGGGGKSGGSRAASAWRPEVIKALRANHLPTSGAYVNAWIRQIDSESSGNAGAHQGIHDVNSGGNEAQGLVQVTPSTFRPFKMAGHGNILNGLDNLMAGIHYAKSRYGSSMLGVIGHGHGYATGGLIKNAGWYNIAEGGYPEWIIPTDPSRRGDAMKMLALAAQDIQRGRSNTSSNKRPNQLPNINSGSDDSSILMQMVAQQQEQIALLTQLVTSNQAIADKDFKPAIDQFTHERQVFNSIDKYERQKSRKQNFKPGEVR
ncbi:phage tail tape measure protein [Staphylococcus pasteuri]|uniref:phage tail tape measure protein n=1 Tax=Staphylococcus pasteuri TaxID=45972 RepID=UPI001E64A06A|nr:phage tail tape measure protein [Staphylococcus pasteuri]